MERVLSRRMRAALISRLRSRLFRRLLSRLEKLDAGESGEDRLSYCVTSSSWLE